MGRPKKISGKQIKWIYNAITPKNPLQFKFEFALWTRPMIQTLICNKYGTKLSLASIGRLLAQLGLTCQKPLMRAFQQSPPLVEKWLREEYSEIKARAQKEGADIFFADEAGVRSDAHSGRTWALRGKTPVIATTGARFGLNMISAVSPKGHLRFMVVPGRVAAYEFSDFLKRLVLGAERPIFLIVDGHPVHRSAKVRKLAESHNGKLKLFYLPPYSPELNPDEYIWNDLKIKNNGVGRMQIAGPDYLKRKVTSHLKWMQRTPDMIRSFFHAPTTKYAA